VKVAGYVTNGYLNSYSLTINENEPIKASVEYSIFHEITNSLSEQSSTGYLGYNRSEGNGIAHYWSSKVMNSDETTVGEVISLNYSFKANWQPVYKIGSSIPSQVTLLGSQENFNLTSEYESNITYSGNYIQDSLNNCATLQLNNLSYLWTETNWFPLTLSLEDGKVVSQTTNVAENNIVTTNIEVVKYY